MAVKKDSVVFAFFEFLNDKILFIFFPLCSCVRHDVSIVFAVTYFCVDETREKFSSEMEMKCESYIYLDVKTIYN